MSGILMSRTQAIILAELNKVKGYQDENNKALKLFVNKRGIDYIK